MDKKYDERLEKGFSLLELAVAVGVVLIFVAVGLLSYRGISSSAKQSAVDKAAATVYDKAYAYLVDGDPKTDPLSVQYEYNASQKDKQDIIVLVSYMGKDKSRLKVRAMMNDFESVRITPAGNTGSAGDPNDGGNGYTGPIIDDDTLTNFTYRCDKDSVGFLPIVNIGPDTKVYIWEKENKNQTFREVKYLKPNAAQINSQETVVRSAARMTMLRTDLLLQGHTYRETLDLLPLGSGNHTEEIRASYSLENIVDNLSEEVPMKAGVEYKIMYDGDVETFTNPGQREYNSETGNITSYGISDCLRSIDNLGNSTNLKNMVYVAGDNLVSVPADIPSTVVNLHGLFENAHDFNDPNITKWDTTNVRLMSSVFYNMQTFNQPIGSWDMSNVVDTRMMFEGSRAFNQNLNGWNMSNVESATRMFQGAESFNNGCDFGKFEKDGVSCALKWRTDSLVEANSMFEGRNNLSVAPYNYDSNFNQNISYSIDPETGVEYWNMSNVETINRMFSGANGFNNRVFNNGQPKGERTAPLGWTFEKENVSMNRTFDGASSFSQGTADWSIVSVSSKEHFARDSNMLCSQVNELLKTNNQCIPG